MEKILNGEIDIYKEFGLVQDASVDEINRVYRRMALRYHPDKNSTEEAAERFHYFSLLHKILLDPLLRKQYDDLCRLRSRKSSGVRDQLLKFRQSLNEQEEDVQRRKRQRIKEQQRQNPQNLAKLQAEGLNLRRKYQSQLRSVPKYISFEDLGEPTLSEFLQPRIVLVKWKKLSNPDAVIDEERLKRIMERFGTVTDSSLTGDDGSYMTGTIEYEEATSAAAAAQHNYRKSAKLWDGTLERKVASLLREVELWGFSKDSEIEVLLQSHSRNKKHGTTEKRNFNFEGALSFPI